MKKELTAVSDRYCTVKELVRHDMRVSSTLIKRLKLSGGILKNGAPVFVNEPLSPGDTVVLVLDEPSSERVIPRAGEVNIVYEDDDYMVIDKQANLPVHPSKGHADDSLANRLAARYESEGFVFRAVNRLDSGTSGLMLTAKHAHAHALMSAQGTEKSYFAAAEGDVPDDGVIDKPIYRPKEATIRRIIDNRGQRAVTNYRVLLRENGLSLVLVAPETGRTHQIRLHFSSIGHPLAGDFLYGTERSDISRAALHCCRLAFVQPLTGQKLEFTSSLPPDIAGLFTAVLSNIPFI